MGAHSYPLVDAVEYGQFGSWLTSFMRCGRTNCDTPTAPTPAAPAGPTNEQIVGNVALLVTQQLQANNKAPSSANAVKTATTDVLSAYSAYSTVQTDSNALSAVVNQVIATLTATGQINNILGTVPLPQMQNDDPTNQSYHVGIDPRLITYGALGLGALMVLTLLKRR